MKRGKLRKIEKRISREVDKYRGLRESNTWSDERAGVIFEMMVEEYGEPDIVEEEIILWEQGPSKYKAMVDEDVVRVYTVDFGEMNIQTEEDFSYS